MQKFAIAAAIGFAVFIGWIIYTANTDQPNIFITWVRSIPYGDKLGHVGLYGTLTLLVNLALRCRFFDLLSKRVLLGSALMAVVVIVEEGSQAFFPSRTLDIGDFAANFTGIVLASLLALFLANKLNWAESPARS